MNINAEPIEVATRKEAHMLTQVHNHAHEAREVAQELAKFYAAQAQNTDDEFQAYPLLEGRYHAAVAKANQSRLLAGLLCKPEDIRACFSGKFYPQLDAEVR